MGNYYGIGCWFVWLCLCAALVLAGGDSVQGEMRKMTRSGHLVSCEGAIPLPREKSACQSDRFFVHNFDLQHDPGFVMQQASGSLVENRKCRLPRSPESLSAQRGNRRECDSDCGDTNDRNLELPAGKGPVAGIRVVSTTRRTLDASRPSDGLFSMPLENGMITYEYI